MVDISVLVKFHLLKIDFFGFGVSPNVLFLSHTIVVVRIGPS